MQSLMGKQGDDARAYIEASETELPDTNIVERVSNAKRSDWQYWWGRYRRGEWQSFPQVTTSEMPTLEDGVTVNYDLWSKIIRKVGNKIGQKIKDKIERSSKRPTIRRPIPIELRPTSRPTRPTRTPTRATPTSSRPTSPRSSSTTSQIPNFYDDEEEYDSDYDYTTENSGPDITTTPYAFYEAPHWGEVGKPPSIDNILSQHGIDKRDEHVLSRPERQIIFGLIMAAIAVGSLLFSATDLDSMASVANSNQAATIQNINDINHRLQIQEKSIKLINRTLSLLEKDIHRLDTRLTIDEIVDECNMALEMMYSEVTRIIRGLSALCNNQLSPDLISMHGLTENLIKLRDRMQARGYVLALDRLEHVFTQPVSYILYGNGSLWAFAHINCYRKSNTYQLWEFNQIPFLSTSDQGETAITIKPESNLIGISDDESRHIILDHRIIDGCTQVGRMKVCDEVSVINTRSKPGCLSSMFLEDMIGIKENCRWYSTKRIEFIQEINSNQFIAYFTEPDNLKISCTDGINSDSKRIPVKGAHRITLQGGCQAYSDHHIMEGQIEFSIQTATYQLNMVNITALLSNDYFTITDKNWEEWEQIRKDIGSPEGIIFKDVSSMYEKYRTKRIWDIGLKSLMGFVFPVVLIGIALCLFKKCFWDRRKANNERLVSYSAVQGGAANIGTLTRTDPTMPPGSFPVPRPSLSGWTAGTKSLQPTPQPSPPRSPSVTEQRLSFATEAVVHDPLKTPQTSKRLMLQTGWSQNFKDKIMSAADHINLAKQADQDAEPTDDLTEEELLLHQRNQAAVKPKDKVQKKSKEKDS